MIDFMYSLRSIISIGGLYFKFGQNYTKALTLIYGSDGVAKIIINVFSGKMVIIQTKYLNYNERAT